MLFCVEAGQKFGRAMKHYHFHVYDGERYTVDTNGMVFPDLAAVVAEAETRVRAVMAAAEGSQDWNRWRIDVRGKDEITLFDFPFEEVYARRDVTEAPVS